jgi:hypothetical protein
MCKVTLAIGRGLSQCRDRIKGETEMLILNNIMEWLNVDLETAKKVLYEMQCTDIRFSEASTATLKRSAKRAYQWVSA